MADAGGPGGANRAAILLMSLGDEAASKVMQHFSPRELKDVTEALSLMQKVTEDEVSDVVESFRQGLKGQTPLGARAPEFTRRVLSSTIGSERADAVIDRFSRSGQVEPVEPLLWIDTRDLADTVRGEHPQVIATVLSMLDAEQAAGVMAELPESIAIESVIRLALLDEIPPAAVSEIEALFAQRMTDREQAASAPVSVDGQRRLAGIVNCLDSELEQSVLDALRDTDESLAGTVEELMFVFENLQELDDRGFQTLLREVSNDLLVPALKGAAPELRDRFFKNMSKRAAEMLRDDLEVSGPMRLSDVEEAQKQVLAVARQLADAGTISLGAKGGEEFV